MGAPNPWGISLSPWELLSMSPTLFKSCSRISRHKQKEGGAPVFESCANTMQCSQPSPRPMSVSKTKGLKVPHGVQPMPPLDGIGQGAPMHWQPVCLGAQGFTALAVDGECQAPRHWVQECHPLAPCPHQSPTPSFQSPPLPCFGSVTSGCSPQPIEPLHCSLMGFSQSTSSWESTHFPHTMHMPSMPALAYLHPMP